VKGKISRVDALRYTVSRDDDEGARTRGARPR